MGDLKNGFQLMTSGVERKLAYVEFVSAYTYVSMCQVSSIQQEPAYLYPFCFARGGT